MFNESVPSPFDTPMAQLALRRSSPTPSNQLLPSHHQSKELIRLLLRGLGKDEWWVGGLEQMRWTAPRFFLDWELPIKNEAELTQKWWNE
jgi:hypothetical protein